MLRSDYEELSSIKGIDDDNYKLHFFKTASDVMKNISLETEYFNNIFMIYIDDRNSYSLDVGGTFFNKKF